MKNSLLFLLWLFLLIDVSCQDSSIIKNNGVSDRLLGNWEVYKYIIGDISTYGKEESDKFIGKTIKISPARFELFEDTLINHKINESMVSSYYLWDNYRMDYKKLGVKDSIDLFEIRGINYDSREIISEIFFIKEDEIIVNEGGNFFFLKKKTNKISPY